MMTKNELLKKYYDLEMNAVHRMSGDYTLSFPLKGMEGSWSEAKERAAMLRDMMEEENAAFASTARSMDTAAEQRYEGGERNAGTNGFED